MDDVGAVDDVEGLSDIMVGDKDAKPVHFQLCDQVSDVVQRNRIDAGKRFVKQQECRPHRQRTGDLQPSSLTTGQVYSRCVAKMRN